jgi:septum formation protein
MVPLILGSSSPRRIDLLHQIGIKPLFVLSPDIDEAHQKSEKPSAYAKRMAGEKLDKCFQMLDILSPEQAQGLEKEQLFNLPILTADTVVACGRRILPKPLTRDDAQACLSLLSGRSHKVITAIAMGRRSGKTRLRVVETHVRVRRIDAKDQEAFLNSKEWEGKAGGYALQGIFSRFIASINGSPSGIIGLPLYETSRLLETEGCL